MNYFLITFIFTFSLFFEALYDSIEDLFKFEDYLHKVLIRKIYLNKLNKVIYLLTLTLGFTIFNYWKSLIIYIVLRTFLFDVFYYRLSGRPTDLKYWLKNNWLIKIIKGFKK